MSSFFGRTSMGLAPRSCRGIVNSPSERSGASCVRQGLTWTHSWACDPERIQKVSAAELVPS